MKLPCAAFSSLSRRARAAVILLAFLASGSLALIASDPTPSASWSKAFGSPSQAPAGAASHSTLLSNEPAKSGPVTIKGTFEWDHAKGQKHDLVGTLTKSSDNSWKITWNFTWGRNTPLTYVGVVHGNLMNGQISGTGDDLQRKRNFSFEGTATDGVWKFDCFEVTKGKSPQGNGEVTVQK